MSVGIEVKAGIVCDSGQVLKVERIAHHVQQSVGPFVAELLVFVANDDRDAKMRRDFQAIDPTLVAKRAVLRLGRVDHDRVGDSAGDVVR